jgi:hypothetical protein
MYTGNFFPPKIAKREIFSHIGVSAHHSQKKRVWKHSEMKISNERGDSDITFRKRCRGCLKKRVLDSKSRILNPTDFLMGCAV